MKYMLDTNICIYIINHKPISVKKEFLKHKNIDICISSITYAELEYGLNKSNKIAQNRRAMTEFLTDLNVLSFDNLAAMQYGIIRHNLQVKGRLIGPLDMLIAAHAKSANLILVTNNVSEFERVEGLRVENWTQ